MSCSSIGPGHTLSLMQRRVAAATPSSWVDGFVSGIDDEQWVEVVSLDGEVVARLWHHDFFDGGAAGQGLAVGDAVAVHPTYHVLAVGAEWFNVLDESAR
jgi:hypothetical protein